MSKFIPQRSKRGWRVQYHKHMLHDCMRLYKTTEHSVYFTKIVTVMVHDRMIYFSLVYPANVCLRDNGMIPYYSLLLTVNIQHTIPYVICSILGYFGGQLSRTASRRIRAIELVHTYIQTGRRTFCSIQTHLLSIDLACILT